MREKQSTNIRKTEHTILQILLLGSAVVVLAVAINLRDPINPIKFLAILIMAAWLLGYILFGFSMEIYSARTLKIWICLTTFFSLSLTAAAAMSDHLYTSVFGQQGRLNGILSYFGLIIISIAAALIARAQLARNFLIFALSVGLILSIYGFIQIQDKDFIPWNNPYNTVITTAGNPNFSAAIMAIFATMTYGSALNKIFSKKLRIFSLALTLFLVYIIYSTNARQGLISIFIGFSVITTVWLYSLKKIIGRLFIIMSSFIGIFAVLGIFQIGPLTSFLYKSSVSVRGYYFRAGIEMFKANPWFGVGIDRYGSYFSEYRELQYPLKYGFAISSNNAHNVPIQFFATGGIFVGVIYLAIILYVFKRSLIAIKLSEIPDRYFISTLFGAWLAYQAQSLVSIDSPGASVLGWLLSGTLVGLSLHKRQFTNSSTARIKEGNKLSIPLRQPICSSILILLVVLFGSFVLKGESLAYQARNFYDPKNLELGPKLLDYANKIFTLPFMNDDYKVLIAADLWDMGYGKEAEIVLVNITTKDPRNKNGQEILALSYYLDGRLDEAIQKRELMTEFDPWDARNLLITGQLYKAIGNEEKMLQIRYKILEFAADTAEGRKAMTDLVSQ